jgi:hypothetical protein
MGLPAGKYSLTITPDITVVPALKRSYYSGHYCGNRSNKKLLPISLL